MEDHISALICPVCGANEVELNSQGRTLVCASYTHGQQPTWNLYVNLDVNITTTRSDYGDSP